MKSFFLLFTLTFFYPLNAQPSNDSFFPWQKGYLDIHHINTGRGNSAFCIFPDGTTLLIDAGDISDTHPRTVSPRNCTDIGGDSLTTGAFIAKYIKKVYPIAVKNGIDFALITHFHDDHFGEVDSLRIKSGNGYVLTGITEVGTLLTIHTLIDRGFDEPIDLFSHSFMEKYADDDYHIVQTLDNYKNFITYSELHKKLVHQKINVGYKNQIRLKYNPTTYPTFLIRNLFGNGRIWDGYNDSSFIAIEKGKYPGENPLSIGIKITYGKFNYYSGGDIPGVNSLGQNDENSMEAQAAPIVGMVDVATLNHHGNRDSQSSAWVRNLRPSVWVQQNWSSDHPGEDVLNRIMSKALYPEQRDIYSTCMTETTRNYIGEKIERGYSSMEGHIVIRVYPSGDRYDVIVIDNDISEMRILKVKEYQSK